MTLALAADSCAHCHGLGLVGGYRRSRGTPCSCVLRSIFRACYDRFVECSQSEKHMSRMRLDPSSGSNRSYNYGRKDEEYMADFCLIARRTLSEEDHKIFRYHYLLAADWRLCAARLGMDRGNFFHAVYRIQRKLGKAFGETTPYALYPLDEYFSSVPRFTVAEMRRLTPARVSADEPKPLVPPLLKAA